MKVLLKKRVAGLALLVIIFMLFYNSSWWMKLVYPIHYQDEILAASKLHHVDPILVAAIIRVESNYRPNSESKKGAIGIMQIMPETANWLFSIDSSLQKYRNNDLTDPKFNIKLGTIYLNYLNDRFDGNRPVVIAAYNAGQGKVSKWLEEGLWDGTLERVDQIPIMETRKYVKSVHYYYNKYTELYGSDF
ncbi:lytic transglycosylase domain-containing protein [Gorillibacterium massiliense]|uniref:lytic transglycosylase domain-containing protein n=1 Tax=Gorillibacterium massiliense TaxID=1280390 RepID=UPI0004B8C417|nr:lytic transglycosylase domain-containing protein [Gorillibacterium massiliense]